MRTFGPDASRYWLAAQGRRVARPFNLRWLLPALCGDDLDVWRFVWLLSWPVLAVGTAWWALGTGTTWQVALAAAALLVALPGVWGPPSAGPERSNNWVYGDGYQSLGLIEVPAEDPTAPPELAFYADEGHWKEGESLRRYTIRVDGFVSLHARHAPGEFVSRLLTFAGDRLTLNFATSAAGSVRVELQDAAGRAMAGFALADCDELFGDTLERTVTWRDRADVGALAGQPVRLRVVMSDADLYSLKFVRGPAATGPANTKD